MIYQGIQDSNPQPFQIYVNAIIQWADHQLIIAEVISLM